MLCTVCTVADAGLIPLHIVSIVTDINCLLLWSVCYDLPLSSKGWARAYDGYDFCRRNFLSHNTLKVGCGIAYCIPVCLLGFAINLKRLLCLLYCTVLHCTALHCTALHCTALHCTALHCTALHCTALHCTVLYSLWNVQDIP